MILPYPVHVGSLQTSFSSLESLFLHVPSSVRVVPGKKDSEATLLRKKQSASVFVLLLEASGSLLSYGELSHCAVAASLLPPASAYSSPSSASLLHLPILLPLLQ
ncbi:hypothetical protein SLEP1_g45576 [Rubroshorea leprosula]|uniref:Uncharacterized protein n=1 Tax=Rubroshorea leprosula TaxID=152421 RepID=A0AAV5LJS8_9ROSI|nr:hypothetical protein SLEP1_g45576 [Rubroshorea leprosula]